MFELVTDFSPRGDQPQAIEKLSKEGTIFRPRRGFVQKV